MKVRGEFLAEELLSDSFSDNTLMNLSGSPTTKNDVNEPKPTSTSDGAPMDEGSSSDSSSVERVVQCSDEWPTLDKSVSPQPSYTEVVQLPFKSTDPGKTPKLKKSIPQFTQKLDSRTPNTQSTPKHKPKPLSEFNKMSDEDLAFLDSDTKSQRKGKAGRNGRNKPKNKQSKKTPSSTKHHANGAYLSPSQRSKLNYLGIHPDSEFVSKVISSHTKRN